MFATQDARALADVLEAFCAPMAVVQSDDGAPFASIAANRLFRDLTREAADDMPGLGDDQAQSRCVACCTGMVTLHYKARSRAADAPWRVTMVPVACDTGLARIVITVNLADDPRTAHRHARTLEDASYFAFQSEFQIARALALVEAMADRTRDGGTRLDLMLLAGLCRSAERGAMDVRRAVDPLLQPAAMAGAGTPCLPAALGPPDHDLHVCMSDMPRLFQRVG